MSLNILDFLDSLSSASLEKRNDGKDGLVGENDEEGSEDTSGDTKEDWIKNDGNALKNAVALAVVMYAASVLSGAVPGVFSVVSWASVVHHVWVWTAVWMTMSDTNSLDITTVTSSL